MTELRNKANIIIENNDVPIYVSKKEADLYENAFVVEDVRNTYAYRKWAKLIKQQSNFVCECCGSEEKLEAHHFFSFKYYVSLRLDLKNGICLCKKCHQEYHKKYNLENTSPFTLYKYLQSKTNL